MDLVVIEVYQSTLYPFKNYNSSAQRLIWQRTSQYKRNMNRGQLIASLLQSKVCKFKIKKYEFLAFWAENSDLLNKISEDSGKIIPKNVFFSKEQVIWTVLTSNEVKNLTRVTGTYRRKRVTRKKCWSG